ncbi:hypothetical protein Avbf_01241 [Armadillidium vulgare]|nr:hypothetical protein Avbf_01241 [Armadillidium vulgare]
MVVPPFSEGDKEPVVLKISFMSILKILGHFNNSLPVFFIYLRPTPAMQIRKQLKMFDRNRFYYNPSSTEESQKRITILPERFDEEVKKILRDQLSGLDLEIKGERRKFFCELDQREANDILVKSSPQDVQSLLPKSLRTDNETTSLVVFPPPPQKGGIEITTDDYCCLEEEQFLNDVILDFYLNSHWFLAVICFPGLDGPVSFSDLKPVVLPNEKVKKTRPPKPKVKVEIPLIDEGEWSDRDEAEGDEEELNEEDEEEEEAEEEPPLKKMKCEEGEEEADTSIDEANTSKSKESKPPPLPSNNNSSTVPEPIKQPCILIFDSLSGASRSRIVATLRDYLTIEHQKKKNKEKIFTKDTMKGACPKVPQQTNFSDCGLFTLQFAESFFGDPIKDFKLPIKTLNKWFDQDVVAGKRKEIATLIKSLMDEHKPNHNITLPQIHFNSKENAPSGSPDNGENEMKAKDLVQSPGRRGF